MRPNCQTVSPQPRLKKSRRLGIRHVQGGWLAGVVPSNTSYVSHPPRLGCCHCATLTSCHQGRRPCASKKAAQMPMANCLVRPHTSPAADLRSRSCAPELGGSATRCAVLCSNVRERYGKMLRRHKQQYKQEQHIISWLCNNILYHTARRDSIQVNP